MTELFSFTGPTHLSVPYILSYTQLKREIAVYSQVIKNGENIP